MYSPTCYISLILDGVSPVVELTEITLPSLWPVEPFKDFWEEKKLYYCSGDLQIVTSRRNRF